MPTRGEIWAAFQTDAKMVQAVRFDAATGQTTQPHPFHIPHTKSKNPAVVVDGDRAVWVFWQAGQRIFSQCFRRDLDPPGLCGLTSAYRWSLNGELGVSQRDRRPPAPPTPAFGIVGFLLFPPDWWETAADMPIQLTLLQGGFSAFRTGPIAP